MGSRFRALGVFRYSRALAGSKCRVLDLSRYMALGVDNYKALRQSRWLEILAALEVSSYRAQRWPSYKYRAPEMFSCMAHGPPTRGL